MLFRSKRIGQLPFGQVLLPILMATTVICRSTGALALLFAGMGLLWASVRFRTRVLLIALLLAGPVYVSVRVTNLWSGRQAVAVAEMVAGADRAESLGIALPARTCSRQGPSNNRSSAGGGGRAAMCISSQIRLIAKWSRRTVYGSFSLEPRGSWG